MTNATTMTPSERHDESGKPFGAGAAPALQGHIPALDAIRGLAILVVTLYRFGGGGSGPALAIDHHWLIQLGTRGVDLFFVLSGFLITGILFDAKHKQHFFRNFYARRTLRIFPLYYGVLIGLVLAWHWVPPTGTPFEKSQQHLFWLWFYGANVVQAVQAKWCLGPLDHFWSLAIEEHFYLVWPFVVFRMSRVGLQRVCLGLVAFSLLGRVGWLACGGNDVAADVFTLFRMDGLALGAWLALEARGPRGLERLRVWAIPVFLTTVVAAVGLAYADKRILTVPHTLWSVSCAAFLLLIVTARPGTWSARLGQNSVLHYFGKYSYGMYMYQNLLIPLMASVISAPMLSQRLGHAGLGQLVYCSLMFGLTTGAAWLSWHGLEKHCLRWKDFFGGHSTVGALPARSAVRV